VVSSSSSFAAIPRDRNLSPSRLGTGPGLVSCRFHRSSIISALQEIKSRCKAAPALCAHGANPTLIQEQPLPAHSIRLRYTKLLFWQNHRSATPPPPRRQRSQLRSEVLLRQRLAAAAVVNFSAGARFCQSETTKTWKQRKTRSRSLRNGDDSPHFWRLYTTYSVRLLQGLPADFCRAPGKPAPASRDISPVAH